MSHFMSFPSTAVSFPVVLGDFGCDVTCQACRENSPALVTQIARTGLGTRLHQRVLYELTMIRSPVGWIERCIILSCSGSSQRSWFDFRSSRLNLQVLFQPLRLFIQLRGSFPLPYLYPQFKIWLISYISIHIMYTHRLPFSKLPTVIFFVYSTVFTHFHVYRSFCKVLHCLFIYISRCLLLICSSFCRKVLSRFSIRDTFRLIYYLISFSCRRLYFGASSINTIFKFVLVWIDVGFHVFNFSRGSGMSFVFVDLVASSCEKVLLYFKNVV